MLKGEEMFWKKRRGIGRRGEVLEGEVRYWKMRRAVGSGV